MFSYLSVVGSKDVSVVGSKDLAAAVDTLHYCWHAVLTVHHQIVLLQTLTWFTTIGVLSNSVVLLALHYQCSSTHVQGFTASLIGATENARHENAAQGKVQDWKICHKKSWAGKCEKSQYGKQQMLYIAQNGFVS